MRIRTLSIILCLCLLISALPFASAGAADTICFISINDQFVDGLAYGSGSVVYVPYTVFSYFHIYYQYYSYTDGATASLYTSDRQFYFDLSTGETTDGAGNAYAVSALLVGGQVYVPVSFVCGQFGLSWSYIYGTGNGDICRIKDSSVVLSDALFLSAAATMMKDRYNAYMGMGTESGRLDPGGDKAEDDGLPVYLTFAGLPSEKLLDILASRKVQAAFFVTADDVRRDPGILRRAVGEGHALGALCSDSPSGQYEETAELIFEAAHVRTLLIAASSPAYNTLCRDAAQSAGLVFWNYTVDGVKGGEGITAASDVTVYLPFQPERADVRILCGDGADKCIAAVFSYIDSASYSLKRVCETENFAG